MNCIHYLEHSNWGVILVGNDEMDGKKYIWMMLINKLVPMISLNTQKIHTRKKKTPMVNK